jgi:hypothetical protein
MDGAAVVRPSQDGPDLEGMAQGHGRGQRSPREPLGKKLAFHRRLAEKIRLAYA